ncbi:hypothetical protein AALP_AA7G002100 [Arabis alpina]|uniref:Uncharacterized protein n=1 Tax=Arabis alpina TaxID=50452 RepID=A0A087GF33_ARAAL|nr:hypothetical protein AALP_AA7G002100 [Arabis alpina]
MLQVLSLDRLSLVVALPARPLCLLHWRGDVRPWFVSPPPSSATTNLTYCKKLSTHLNHLRPPVPPIPPDPPDLLLSSPPSKFYPALVEISFSLQQIPSTAIPLTPQSPAYSSAPGTTTSSPLPKGQAEIHATPDLLRDDLMIVMKIGSTSMDLQTKNRRQRLPDSTPTTHRISSRPVGFSVQRVV